MTVQSEPMTPERLDEIAGKLKAYEAGAISLVAHNAITFAWELLAEVQRLRIYEEQIDFIEHYLVIDGEGWFIEHSIQCRLAGLTHCEYHDWVRSIFEDGPVEGVGDGRYHMTYLGPGAFELTGVTTEDSR